MEYENLPRHKWHPLNEGESRQNPPLEGVRGR